MEASRRRPLRTLILVLDAALVVAAVALAAGLHTTLRHYLPGLKETSRFDQYALLAYLSVPLWIVLTALFGMHRVFERVWTRTSLIVDLLKVHIVGFLGLSAALFFTKSNLNRSAVLMFLGCSFLLSYLVRAALAYWLGYQHRVGQGRTRLLVVGDDSPEMRDLLASAAREQRPPLVVGHLGDAAIDALPYLGTLDAIAQVLHDESIDHVLFFHPYDHASKIEDALAACETVGVPAELAVVAKSTLAPPRVLELYGRPFISFDAAPKAPERIAIKHAFDWVVAAVLVLMLAPLFLFIALAILVTMGRPVFFTQQRAGLHGRQFRMIKFRTMIKDAEEHQRAIADRNEMTGPVFKVTDDPRITRLGAFLRRTSLDELPQFFNVLMGSMSLVGPRPLDIREQQKIRGWHRRRLSMRPGITGIWQVSGRSDVDFEEWMRLDQKYVDEWSLRLDLSLLAKTIPAVLFRRGAR